MKNLQELQNLATEKWNFGPETYAQFTGGTGDQNITFAVRHIMEHVVKSTGRIATAVESAEHHGRFVQESIPDEPWKLILAGLRLAEVLNIDGKTLTEQLEDWAVRFGD